VQVFSIKRACPSCGTSFGELDPRLFSFNSKHGWCEGCFGTGLALEGFDEEQSGEETAWNEWLEGDAHACEACDGQRLNQVALHVRFRDLNIADLTHQAIDDTVSFVGKLRLSKREGEIARDLMAEIKSRMAFLQRVGLGYLPLERSAPTLSGGEAQRIRLAAQLGSNLQGVCYVLDEPAGEIVSASSERTCRCSRRSTSPGNARSPGRGHVGLSKVRHQPQCRSLCGRHLPTARPSGRPLDRSLRRGAQRRLDRADP
jgi:excinuclease UvrABC ATPase subunit